MIKVYKDLQGGELFIYKTNLFHKIDDNTYGIFSSSLGKFYVLHRTNVWKVSNYAAPYEFVPLEDSIIQMLENKDNCAWGFISSCDELLKEYTDNKNIMWCVPPRFFKLIADTYEKIGITRFKIIKYRLCAESKITKNSYIMWPKGQLIRQEEIDTL